MKVVFISNYLSPHQIPFCQEMYKRLETDFMFVATLPVSDARKSLGYKDMDHSYPFVICAYDGREKNEEAKKQIDSAEIAIIGTAPWELINKRVYNNKIVFRCCERQLKKGLELYKYPIRFIRWHIQNPIKKRVFLLCASAYTINDFSLFGLFRNKAYKWGYFPETKKYESIKSIIDNKVPNTLLWVGRFLNWKNPDVLVKVAAKLKQDGYTFSLKMIGTGPQKHRIQDLVLKMELSECVDICEPMPSEKIREVMEQSAIYIFPSNRQEGWGAVLNEAMNSGCAVVANDVIGSVPYLIDSEENGIVYHDGNIEQIVSCVKDLLDNPLKAKKLGEKAYETIIAKWNAEVAAERFIHVCELMLENENTNRVFEDGVCSRADVIHTKKVNK